MNLNSFLTSENGAVTVEWVVLTAALTALGLATVVLVSGGVEDLSGEMQAELSDMDPAGGIPSAEVQKGPFPGEES